MCFYRLSGGSHNWPTLRRLSACKTPRSTGGRFRPLICLQLVPPPLMLAARPALLFRFTASFWATVSLLPCVFGRGDVMALDLFTPDGFFNPSTTGFTIGNSYSVKGHLNNTRSLPREIIFPASPLATLTLGDLNIHHPPAAPLRVFKEDQLATSTPYFDKATDWGFTLLNVLGVFTQFSMSLIGRPGILDLAFACRLLARYFSEWSDPLPSTGSAHIPILLGFKAPLFRAPPGFKAPLFRAPPPAIPRALTDWPAPDSSLQGASISPAPSLPTTRLMDVGFKTNLGRITAKLALHIPVKWVTYLFKPWWSDLLLQLRKDYNSTLRSSKVDRLNAALLASARGATTPYFKAIKEAKRDDWTTFLATATPQTVQIAKNFALGRCPLASPSSLVP